MKNIYKIVAFIILAMLVSFYAKYHSLSTNYPLNIVPNNYFSARFLANTVTGSNCSGLALEYEGKINEAFYFSCYNEVPHNNSYSIYIFPNMSVKNRFIKKIKKDGFIFKAGEYFLIKENLFYGGSKYNNPRPITVDDYKGFLGEVINPQGNFE